MRSDETGRALQRAAVVFVTVLIVAFLVAYLTRWHSERALARAASAAAPSTVDVIIVHGNSGNGSLTLPGATAAWFESTIYARVSGYVAKWYVDIGDHVRAGQVLTTIETPELDAELAAARAKLQVAQAQVKVKQAGAAFASSTYARWRDSPKGVVSEQEREDKKAGAASASAELEAAHAQVALDQADVDRLSAFEQFKRVTAPYDGVIVQRQVDIGNLVTAGNSGNTTPLYRMAQVDPIRVFVDVPQSAAPDLMKSGVPASILTNGAASAPIAGNISRTSDAVDPQARTFRVEIDIPNGNRRLVPGLYVQVAFQLQNSGMSQVPAAALTFSAAGPRVAVVDPDDTVHFRPVTIGRDDGDHVELSSGVSNGERLILNASDQLTDGEKVHVSSQTDGASDVAMREH